MGRRTNTKLEEARRRWGRAAIIQGTKRTKPVKPTPAAPAAALARVA